MSRQPTDDDRRRATGVTARCAATALALALGAAAAGTFAGCGSPPRPNLRSEDPAAKVPAIKIAVREQDRQAVRVLVRDLRDVDPAVRFYAIQGLRRLTGENFGFRYYDDERAREPAVQRWERWLAEHHGTASIAGPDHGFGDQQGDGDDDERNTPR